MNAQTETFTPAQAAKWNADARIINNNVSLARSLVETGQQVPGQSVSDLLRDAQRASERLQVATRSAAGVHAKPSTVPPIPIDKLRTDDTELLLSLLERAQAVAERVDASRGRSLDADVPLLPGESRGTDLAEAVSLLALRVRGEVQGPQGRE